MTTPGFTVRPYRDSDAADLADILHRAVAIIGRRYYSAAQVEAWLSGPRDERRIREKNADGRKVWVAAGAGDRPVAYIDLEPDGHIDMLFCAPEASGRGLASALYRRLEAFARQQKLPGLFAEASEAAKPVFEHWGFTVVARRDFEIRSVPIHNYEMRKEL
jgi:putative acetyltransferase